MDSEDRRAKRGGARSSVAALEVGSHQILMKDGSTHHCPFITVSDGDQSIDFIAQSTFKKEADLNEFISFLEEFFTGIEAGAAFDA